MVSTALADSLVIPGIYSDISFTSLSVNFMLCMQFTRYPIGEKEPILSDPQQIENNRNSFFPKQMAI